MKKWLKIVLIISLLINVFFIVLEINYNNRFESKPTKIEEVDIDAERTKFFTELKNKHPQLSNKKYFFLNVWRPGDWESMEQMPMLDTLIEPLRNDFAYVFVCEDETTYAWRKLKERTKKAKNFVYINGKKNFISSIYQEKKMLHFKWFKQRMTPMTVIMNGSGTVLYSDTLQSLWGMLNKGKPMTPKRAKVYTDSLQATYFKRYITSIDNALKALK